MSGPLVLNLGCGSSPVPGWINCDYLPHAGVDQVFDLLDAPWPFETGSVEAIYAAHVLEHLAAPRTFFREAWRVLRPDSGMLIRVPYGAHRAAWYDIEHVRPWFAESFCFLQPGYAEAIGNPQHDAWDAPFKVDLAQLRVSARVARILRTRWRRRLLLPRVAFLFESQVEELWIHLRALKTPLAWQFCREERPPNVVPFQFAAYRHHLEGRALVRGQGTELVPLAEGETVNGFGTYEARIGEEG